MPSEPIPEQPAVQQPSKVTVEFDPSDLEHPKLVVQMPDGFCYFAALEPLS